MNHEHIVHILFSRGIDSSTNCSDSYPHIAGRIWSIGVSIMRISHNVLTVNKAEVRPLAMRYINNLFESNTIDYERRLELWDIVSLSKDRASVLTNVMGIKLIGTTGENFSYDITQEDED